MLFSTILATTVSVPFIGTLATPAPLPVNYAEEGSGKNGTGTVLGRAPQPSDYPLPPGPYINEFKYVNWDPTDDTQKAQLEKIHEAFGEWRQMAAEALQLVENNDETVIKRWYGDEPRNELRGVFANMWDKNSGQATTQVSQMVCDKEDFDNYCGPNPTANAYTRDQTGRFHICPKGLRKKLNVGKQCSDLDPSCSKEMRTLPMVLLHEMTHYTEIGEAATGIRIVDEASGAYACFKLKSSEKADNAQNYAWIAGEAYWGNFCDKTFQDPAPGVQK
jgi:hypothetical protein